MTPARRTVELKFSAQVRGSVTASQNFPRHLPASFTLKRALWAHALTLRPPAAADC